MSCQIPRLMQQAVLMEGTRGVRQVVRATAFRRPYIAVPNLSSCATPLGNRHAPMATAYMFSALLILHPQYPILRNSPQKDWYRLTFLFQHPSPMLR